jgi:uncharacterized protein (TIGR02757 family)
MELTSSTRSSPKQGLAAAHAERLRIALDRLYTSFNYPESAFDPIQVVRRYEQLDDREVVAFVAAALAFGRVTSVVASIEAVCRVLGSSPAAFVRGFDPRRDGDPLRPLVHRWVRGADFVALLWMLRRMIEEHGSLERCFAHGNDPAMTDVGPGIQAFCSYARALDFRPAYGRVPKTPGVFHFLARPSTGSACKRLNLFLRWMVRQDGVDPGGWTTVPRRQLVVPLDTHTIRTGRCLRLTRRASPGWKMAADITAALRQCDPDDPVRYDFALCHLSMMGACGFGAKSGDRQCPLRGNCVPNK